MATEDDAPLPDYNPEGGSGGGTDGGTDDPVTVTYVVEDGSGKSDANSYATIAEADAYMNDYKNLPAEWDTSTEVQKQVAMIRGTQYIEDLARGRFKGVQTSEDQALQYPRDGVINESGYSIDHDEIPVQLKFSVFESALRVRQGTSLVPDDTTGGGVKKELVEVGTVKIANEFFVSKTLPVFYEVTRKLTGLLKAGGMLSRA